MFTINFPKILSEFRGNFARDGSEGPALSRFNVIIYIYIYLYIFPGNSRHFGICHKLSSSITIMVGEKNPGSTCHSFRNGS
jgi:hypothetical protein